MDTLDNMYTELIMEHSVASPYKHSCPHPTASAHGHNPNCGDDITIDIITDGDIITDISFTGSGCAISQSSTSIMIETLVGKTTLKAKSIIATYLKMIKRGKLTQSELDSIGNAFVYQGISNMPSRVKCATMPWHTMEDLLNKLNSIDK